MSAMALSAKPFASLSSGLLARKGQAKPAMRPQLLTAAAPLDDLGWNDMGAAEVPAPPVDLPPVLAAREELAARVAAPIEVEAVVEPTVAAALAPVVAARIGRESAKQTARGKAAFTLRLEPARHLRLRLASAIADRSAQALVADALDAFLRTMPEVEALAAQLPGEKD